MTTPSFVVVDASVALKWVLDDEEGVDQAVMLRDEGIEGRLQLVAPSLWLYSLRTASLVRFGAGAYPRRTGGEVLPTSPRSASSWPIPPPTRPTPTP